MSTTRKKKQKRAKPIPDPVARIPPQDIAAERAVLGAILIEVDDQTWCQCAYDLLTPPQFYRASHRLIFQALCKMHDAGQTPDELLLRVALEESDDLEAVGGADYLHELATSVPSAANVERYALQVHTKHRLRQIINACTATLREAEDPGAHPADALGRLQARVATVTTQDARSQPVAFATILEEECKKIDMAAAHYQETGSSIIGIPSGLRDLDQTTGGFRPGMTVIAARPSVGKSALGTTICANLLGLEEIPPVLFFTTEMSRGQVAMRILSAYAGLSCKALSDGTARPSDIERAKDAYLKIEQAPFTLDDTPRIDLAHVRAHSLRMVSEEGVKLVIVDFLHTMVSDRAESREQELDNLSKGLKWLAREVEVPLLVMAQLNRPERGQENKAPVLTRLRGSGGIEEAADNVIILHRCCKEQAGNPEDDGILVTDTSVHVAKQKEGPTKRLKATFRRLEVKFVDWHKED